MRLIKYLISVSFLLLLLGYGALHFMPESVYNFAVDARRGVAGLEKKVITTPTGHEYVYLEGGEGEPLLLIHGFGADKDNFTDIAKYLTDEYHVIAPDLTGFGESSKSQEINYFPKDQAERLYEFTQTLGIDVKHIGGSSMGGQISMHYALLHPNKIESMWLIAPAGIRKVTPSLLDEEIKRSGTNKIVAHNEEEFIEMFDFVMSKPPFIPEQLLRVMAQPRIKNVDLEKRIFNEIHQDALDEPVSGMKTPALIVWGNEDNVLHADAAVILNKLLPKSKAIVMEGIGHLPMLEAPKRVAKDYKDFRESL